MYTATTTAVDTSTTHVSSYEVSYYLYFVSRLQDTAVPEYCCTSCDAAGYDIVRDTE